MNLTFLADNNMPLVMAACLIIGYCIKHIKKLNGKINEFIPLIMAVLGCSLGCLAYGLSLENAVYGAFSGLASTGLHQLFKQFLCKTQKGDSDSNENN